MKLIIKLNEINLNWVFCLSQLTETKVRQRQQREPPFSAQGNSPDPSNGQWRRGGGTRRNRWDGQASDWTSLLHFLVLLKMNLFFCHLGQGEDQVWLFATFLLLFNGWGVCECRETRTACSECRTQRCRALAYTVQLFYCFYFRCASVAVDVVVSS